MDGYQIGLLVFINQNFTFRFVFLKPGCNVANFGGYVLAVGSNLVIIGLILPYGR
jgi:hypothetical protein